MPKILSKCSSVTSSERHESPAARIGEEHVDAPLLLLDRGVEAVEVGELGDVALRTAAAPCCRSASPLRVELGLAAAGDEDVGAFGNESLGGGEADAAAAAGYESDFF